MIYKENKSKRYKILKDSYNFYRNLLFYYFVFYYIGGFMKNIRLFKKSIRYLLVFLICIIISTNVYAKEDNGSLKKHYSDAYLEYLNLSDEEKAKREVVPEKYDVSVNEYFSKRKDMALLGDVPEIPFRFDLRDVIDIKVENQGTYGLCWAFASSNALETNLALREGNEYDFSEMHANYLTSSEFCEMMGIEDFGYRNLHDGGNFSMFFDSYSLVERGPVSEEKVPYIEVSQNDYPKLLKYGPESYIHETIRFPDITTEDDENIKNQIINDVKTHIMTNGALYASICSYSIYETENNAVLNEQNIDNKNIRDHAITIIGWDDNYSKENFPDWCRPQNDGAYIALNSWGEEFGDNGIFYISYEDIVVHGELMGVVFANNEPYEYITIKFEDYNLYYSIVSTFPSYIKEYNEETLEIVIKESLVKRITSLSLYQDVNLKGLEYFSGLEYLYLHDVNIESGDNKEILKSFVNLKQLVLSEIECEDWSFLNELSLDGIYLANTNYYDINLLLKNNNFKSFEFYDYYSNVDYGEIDLSSNNRLNYVSIYMGENNSLKISGLNKNLKQLNIDNVSISSDILKENIKLEEISFSNVDIENINFINKDFKNLQYIYLTNLDIDLTPLLKLEQNVNIFLFDMKLDNMDGFAEKYNFNIEVQNCYIEEYLCDEINVKSKKSIEIPKFVKYIIDCYMYTYGMPIENIQITNGKFDRNIEKIILNTDEKGVSIPLEIKITDEIFGEEYCYFKYNMYYDVIEKEGWFNDYAKITYSTHVENDGWQDYVTNNDIAGTSGRALRLEGIKIDLDSNIKGAGIKYSTHVENIGWQDYVSDNQMAGTEGQSLRLEAIKIELSENLDIFYDIYYRVHAQNVGWMNWAKNGEVAGTQGMSYRLEAIQIAIVEEGSNAPVQIPNLDCNEAFLEIPHITYNTHVENIGWIAPSKDGVASGSLGNNLRMESYRANIESSYDGYLIYNTYVQDRGWQENDALAGEISGTEGESLQAKAIYMFLTGELDEKYDIYYRVLLDNETVWQGWTLNGEAAGCYTPDRYIQAIQIVLRDKGGLPPKDTGRPSIIFYTSDEESVG